MKHLRTTTETERTTLKIEGFDVPHAHIHLIPCNTAKEFWNKVSLNDPIDNQALETIWRKVTLIPHAD